VKGQGRIKMPPPGRTVWARGRAVIDAQSAIEEEMDALLDEEDERIAPRPVWMRGEKRHARNVECVEGHARRMERLRVQAIDWAPWEQA
jgi:hypothetical protein